MSQMIAWCPPGARETAEQLLAGQGVQVDELTEHPDLTNASHVVVAWCGEKPLDAEPPRLAHWAPLDSWRVPVPAPRITWWEAHP